MGAWIEIYILGKIFCVTIVAPLVGAWIEIYERTGYGTGEGSLPLWERGLKFVRILGTDISIIVAPLVGAWIEISYLLPHIRQTLHRRSPCGSVD